MLYKLKENLVKSKLLFFAVSLCLVISCSAPVQAMDNSGEEIVPALLTKERYDKLKIRAKNALTKYYRCLYVGGCTQNEWNAIKWQMKVAGSAIAAALLAYKAAPLAKEYALKTKQQVKQQAKGLADDLEQKATGAAKNVVNAAADEANTRLKDLTKEVDKFASERKIQVDWGFGGASARVVPIEPEQKSGTSSAASKKEEQKSSSPWDVN